MLKVFFSGLKQAGIFMSLSVLLSACGSKAMEQSIFSRIDSREMEKLAKSKSDFYVFYEDVQNITRRAVDYQAAYSSITYKELYEYETKYYLNSSFRAREESKAGAAFDAEYDRDVRPALELQKRKWGDFVRNHDPNQYLSVEAVTGIWQSHPEFYFIVREPKAPVKTASISYDGVVKGAKTSSELETVSLTELRAINSSDNASVYDGITDPLYWDTHEMLIIVNRVELMDGSVYSLNDPEMKQVPASVRAYFANPCQETEDEMARELVNPYFKTRTEYVGMNVQEALRRANPLCYELLKNYR